MKIVGLTYLRGVSQMYVKPDVALLVNRKPFFLPHFSEQIEAHRCVVVKISRMGRCIEARFASRYYEEVAPACNFMVRGLNENTGLDSLTKGLAFDNSMAVGEFAKAGEMKLSWYADSVELPGTDLAEGIDNAVAEVSRYVTLRTGDMVAIDYKAEALPLQREMVITAKSGDEELLYCKVK